MIHPFRKLPQVAKVLEEPPLVALRDTHSAHIIAEAVRAELDAARSELHVATDDRFTAIAVAERAALRLQSETPKLLPVINATGITLHTNLGRAPLAEVAARAAYDVARRYSNLEFDLASGERAHRQDAVRAELLRLTGAEAATVVNNCAAATLLSLRALAFGKEAIVSRGQLVEIGGSYRLPEIMAASGAILREVGTTNRTRLADYRTAIGPNTALILRVHPSNYRVRGFTESVGLEELVTLGVPVIDDVGSGAMVPFGDEPMVQLSVKAGADLVVLSGDKLMGGPQAGIVVGKLDAVERLERDPLFRAVRIDKMTLAALEATLRLYRDPGSAQRDVPALRMLTTTRDELRTRAVAFAERLRSLPNLSVEVRDDTAYAGGGTLPDEPLPGVVLALASSTMGEGEFAERLRNGHPPVVARVHRGKLVIDLRCVFAEQEQALHEALAQASG